MASDGIEVRSPVDVVHHERKGLGVTQISIRYGDFDDVDTLVLKAWSKVDRAATIAVVSQGREARQAHCAQRQTIPVSVGRRQADRQRASLVDRLASDGIEVRGVVGGGVRPESKTEVREIVTLQYRVAIWKSGTEYPPWDHIGRRQLNYVYWSTGYNRYG